MESLVLSRSFWRGRRVFVTGHTGFKGGWLSLWLTDMGAEVHGYALAPATDPCFFSLTRLDSRLASSTIDDICDREALARAVRSVDPEIVFHLAAQALVRHSYASPVETYAVNVMGTVNLMEAVRQVPSVRAVVNVTSDKCYDNREWVWPYRENDPLGGNDPYSSSKGCSELVTAAYRRSFFGSVDTRVATARAGNVIGGGDWAADRLVPDAIRAWQKGACLRVRSPGAVRPWQHVLEPLSGYLLLAERLFAGDGLDAVNFGPDQGDALMVAELLDCMGAHWGAGANWQDDSGDHLHEAGVLRLDSSKARLQLGWRPRWCLAQALEQVVAWHRALLAGADMCEQSLQDIALYEAAN